MIVRSYSPHVKETPELQHWYFVQHLHSFGAETRLTLPKNGC
jgi:hypothetical protein